MFVTFACFSCIFLLFVNFDSWWICAFSQPAILSAVSFSGESPISSFFDVVLRFFNRAQTSQFIPRCLHLSAIVRSFRSHAGFLGFSLGKLFSKWACSCWFLSLVASSFFIFSLLLSPFSLKSSHSQFSTLAMSHLNPMSYCQGLMLVSIAIGFWLYRVLWLDRAYAFRCSEVKSSPIRAIALTLLLVAMIANVSMQVVSLYVLNSMIFQVRSNKLSKLSKLLTSFFTVVLTNVHSKFKYQEGYWINPVSGTIGPTPKGQYSPANFHLAQASDYVAQVCFIFKGGATFLTLSSLNRVVSSWLNCAFTSECVCMCDCVLWMLCVSVITASEYDWNS